MWASLLVSLGRRLVGSTRTGTTRAGRTSPAVRVREIKTVPYVPLSEVDPILWTGIRHS